ncbi:hypothetical protein HaLaN_01460 [Haematococcus lacustris]|uniref:Uncharacterized protein n=1 Tax=Haematococcus lacustris TaxID=44745 RepID=A0A699Y9C1_HAELA|nr:hypothetical protein HaLaN_01460 [Haematococcus lacustris]
MGNTSSAPGSASGGSGHKFTPSDGFFLSESAAQVSMYYNQLRGNVGVLGLFLAKNPALVSVRVHLSKLQAYNSSRPAGELEQPGSCTASCTAWLSLMSHLPTQAAMRAWSRHRFSWYTQPLSCRSSSATTAPLVAEPWCGIRGHTGAAGCSHSMRLTTALTTEQQKTSSRRQTDPTKLIQQGITCRTVGNLTQLLQTSCSILGRTLDDYQPHTGGTLSWG